MLAANSNGGICLSVAALALRAGAIPTRHPDVRDHHLRVPNLPH
jgi:hypothetical protein